MKKSNKSKRPANGDGLNFKAQPWDAADKMRGHMEPSEYKHAASLGWLGEPGREALLALADVTDELATVTI